MNKMKHRFILPIAAVPWQAPLVGRRGARSPGKYSAYRDEIALRARTIYRGPCYDGVPIAVEYLFVLPRTTGMLVPCGPRDPDTGNLEKGLADSLQKITWCSDKWLVSIRATKRYVEPGEEPYIHVAFEPVVFNFTEKLDEDKS